MEQIGRGEIPKDFDDLGRTRDEASYIAVVHTDGNGMGERIKQNRQGNDNREYFAHRPHETDFQKEYRIATAPQQYQFLQESREWRL